MDIRDLQQYIGKKVYFTLKNGFKYKIILKGEYFRDNVLNFPDKYSNPVSIDISEINYITISNE